MIYEKPDPKCQFLLHWWGGAAPYIKETLKINSHYLWFETEEELTKVFNQIMSYEHHGLRFNAMSVAEGHQIHTRCIVTVKAEYEGKKYEFDYDFEYGYDEHNAEYMFTEGNYGCDCNLSIFINEKYPDFEEMECGDRIKYDFTMRREP